MDSLDPKNIGLYINLTIHNTAARYKLTDVAIVSHIYEIFFKNISAKIFLAQYPRGVNSVYSVL